MIANKLKIDGTEYDLPSGADALFKDDIVVIKNGNAINTDIHLTNFEYSTDERVVGCWINGKPIYEKTIVTTSPPSSAYLEKPLPISNSETILDLEVFIDRENGDYLFNFSSDSTGFFEAWVRNSNHTTTPNTLSINLTRTAYQNKPMYVIVKYTKTTDLPNSFKPSMLNIKSIVPQHNYSTEEKVVGTWIDGKTIYEKTVEIPELPNNARIPISQCDGTLIDAKGYCYSKIDPTSIRLIPFAAGGANDIRVDQTEGYIRVWTFADWRTYTAYVTYQYLKD